MSGAIETLGLRESIESAFWRVANLEKELESKRKEEIEISERLHAIYIDEMKNNEAADAIRADITAAKDNQEIKEKQEASEDIDRKIVDVMHKISQLERDKKDAENPISLININSSIASYEYQIPLLHKRPSACSIDDCPFISAAIKAKKEVNELVEKRSAIQLKILANVNGIQGEIDYPQQRCFYMTK